MNMHYTIFDTPVLKTLARLFSLLALKLSGWRTEGRLPDIPKFVMIAAPHTSNWDFVLLLFMAFAFRVKVYWMGKDALFRQPFYGLFKWLGGIPIDRSKSNNVVSQSIQQFNNNDKLVLAIPPSGTRKKVFYWKSGFYHIANGAEVPIALSFLDYGRKVGGFGPTIKPTGNIEEDMKSIKAFYADISGKYPEKTVEAVAVRPV